MNMSMLKSIGVAFVPAVATFALLQACGGGSEVFAQAASGADPIEGVWESAVSLRDCSSGAVVGSFRGTNMLHRGGTLTDTNGSAPTTRGVGMGVWSKTAAGYVGTFRFFRYNPDGSLAGSQRVTRTMTLSADGNTVNSVNSTLLLDNAGTVVQTLCATDVSTRFVGG